MLKRRAALLASVRQFFARRNVLEVSTPLLSTAGTTDVHIASLTVSSLLDRQQTLYLHTSPELAMKRLLAADSGSIFQLCPVFRDGDQGRQHHREFTMLEWYQVGFSYHALMDEVEALVMALAAVIQPIEPIDSIGLQQPAQRLSYQQAFRQYLDIDIRTATVATLASCCQAHNLSVPADMGQALDPWLDLMISVLLAPQLPRQQLTFIYDYPASQAALAKIRSDDYPVAERFELYWGAMELANGYQELTDPQEQARRFRQDLQQRQTAGLPEIPVDAKFMAAMQAGLPECAGVALGIDRLLMQLAGATHIHDVLSFADI